MLYFCWNDYARFRKSCNKRILLCFYGFLCTELFFHICKSVQKRIFKKFKVQYYADKDFARASRLVVFLAFVPICIVDDAFEELCIYIASTYPVLTY